MRFLVLFDACVFYPAPLRDFLLDLALTDLFAARWTERIHDEWIRNPGPWFSRPSYLLAGLDN